MEQNEMINKLHERAGISKEDALDALERAQWDMLGALQILENEGKISPLTASMTTTDNQNGYEEVKRTASGNENGKFRGNAQGFFDKVGVLLRKSISNSFVVERKGEVILSMPVLIMLVILFSMFYFTAAAVIAGLFFDCRYSIEKR